MELKAFTPQIRIEKRHGDELGGRQTPINLSTDMIDAVRRVLRHEHVGQRGLFKPARTERRRKIQAVLYKMVNEALRTEEVILKHKGTFLHQLRNAY